MSSNRTFLRLLGYLRPYKGYVYSATITTILNKFFDILPEALIGVAVDVVVNKHHSFVAQWGIQSLHHQLYFLGLLVFISWTFESIFEYISTYQWGYLAYSLQNSLRVDAYARVQNSSMSFFTGKKTGEIVATLNDDVNNLEKFLEYGISDFIRMVFGTCMVVVIFCYLNFTIAALSLLPIPFIFLVMLIFQWLLGSRYMTVRRAASSIATRLFTNISGIIAIKSYVTETFESQRVEKESKSYEYANMDSLRISAAFIPVVRMVIVLGFMISLVLGGIYVLSGTLNIGAYSTLIFMSQRLLWPFTNIAHMLQKYERDMACARRVFSLLDTSTIVYSGNQRLEVEDVVGDISFKNVSFSYTDNVKIFNNLSFSIPAGHTVGFVGSTGSGKSTVVRLLLRFYEPSEGIITLDGIDISDLTPASVRKSIALVSQEHFLFYGTIAENISYGTFGATREDIIRVANQAEANEFIDDLPEGYDTLVGEQGFTLSGGQRQRISLARAILKNAPIFVFDEATSAVDNETEAEIQRSLEKLWHKKTTIVIAHRLSTVRNADTIYVMDEGTIIESGTHEELLEINGMYARLWNIQTGQIND